MRTHIEFYSTTVEKLRVVYQTAVPNITVAIGSVRELAPSEIQCAYSTDYLLGGSFTLRNGRIDKFQFEEGYCQATEYSGNASQDDFFFYYYNRDHLGNNREVVDASGAVQQVTNYYPSGVPYTQSDAVLNASLQPYKYNFSIEREKKKLACSSEREKNRPKVNNKELGRMHGLDTYDYGARQYAPVLGRWDRMDPLCEKYYDISPYAYCHNNPVSLVDIDGRNPVYNYFGNYLGSTSEGFNGDIYIYYGEDEINVSKYSLDELLSKYGEKIDIYEVFKEYGSEEAFSNIWTHIVSQFEGKMFFDEKFSMSSLYGERISFNDLSNNNWQTDYVSNSFGYTPHISGTNLFTYEGTVENIASSIIVHEWYSHGMKLNHDIYKSHRLAYQNVIKFKELWNKTTNKYKSFVLSQLQWYTEKETGKTIVSKPYRRLYNLYCK